METLIIAFVAALAFYAVIVLSVMEKDLKLATANIIKLVALWLQQFDNEGDDASVAGRQEAIVDMIEGLSLNVSKISGLNTETTQHRILEKISYIYRTSTATDKKIAKAIELLEDHYGPEIFDNAQANLYEAERIAQEVQKSAEEAVIVEPEVIDQLEKESAVGGEYEAEKKKAKELYKAGHNKSYIARNLKKSRTTITKWLNE